MKLRIPRLSLGRSTDGEGADGGDRAPAAAGSLLRGYGPLAAFGVLFILMAGFVPSVTPTVATGSASAGTGGSDYVDPTSGGIPGVTSGGPGDVDATGGGSGDGQSAAGGPTAGPSGGDGGSEPAPGRGAGSCAGKDVQVPGDPYSPPCIEFTGENPGATHRGVTADTIKVSFRTTGEKGFNQTLAELAGAQIVDEPADIERTAKVYEQFFNDNYQFYGRKLDIEFYSGSSNTTCELLGGCRGRANNDADRVEQEMGAFLEMNCGSEPYCDALADRGVVNFGSPYLSRDWHNVRHPYSWSIATDGTIVAEAAAQLAVNTLRHKKARWAGGALTEQDRYYAGLSPENDWYQVSHDRAIDILERNGMDPGIKINYKLDINSMSNQAANVIAKMKSEGVTTALCGCDPIFPVFLTSKAKEQNYFPEWVVLGTALTDWDVAAQLYNGEVWKHAFGISSLGQPRPIRAGLGYSVYKSARDDEPAFAAELLYGTLVMIASGIQMAGPNLNPDTFAQGLLAWPGGSGPYGTWGFTEGNHTPTTDYRVIYWNNDKISIVNSQPGAYETAYDKARFPVDALPTGDLQVFERDQ